MSVGATRDCTWTVEAEGGWISPKTQTGQGEGAVEFTASANPDPVVRRGALIFNTQRAEITQSAAACVITFAETSASFPPAGGTGQLEVRASSSLCTWTASADEPWVSIRGGTDGKGNAALMFDVAATTGPPRTGTITVAGQRFSITQSEGCTYTIAPQNVSFSPTGGQATITVNTSPGCPWTTSASVPWIVIPQTTGSGPGLATITVQPTSGPARTGRAVVAGQPVTVTQSQGCTYQVQPATHSIAAAGGSVTVNVESPPGCPWTAAGNVPWIAAQASSQEGNGVVTLTVPPTNGPARTGTATIAGQTVTINQSQGCTFTVSPTQESHPSGGGSGRVNVTTADGCSWTAATEASWIAITSGASGTGTGTVSYNVPATTGPARTGTLTVAGQTVTVNQGTGCSFNLSPASANVPEAGGQTSFEVQTAAGCSWTAQSQASWIQISPHGGNGTGTLQVTVAGNSGPPRTGTVTAGGRSFTVNQRTGCAIQLSPAGENAPPTGFNGTVNVTAGQGCAWTATSSQPWLTITNPPGGAGSGNGQITYTVDANAGGARTATLNVSGQTFTVNQASGCTFTPTPDSVSSPAPGGSFRIDVATAAGCGWTAGTGDAWITVSAPGGNGPGSVTLTVAPNSGPPRTGSVAVAGRSVTVTQDSGCTFSINPSSAIVPPTGGGGSVNVMTAPGCGWTAVSQASWIIVPPPASGAGDGSVPYTVEANTTGAPRVGTIVIAGVPFAVNQQ